MAGRIVGMITVLTLVGVIASAAVLLFLAFDAEDESARRSAELFAESVARSLLDGDIRTLSDAEVDALVRLNEADGAQEETANLTHIWVFNPEARQVAASAGTPNAERNEITVARRAIRDASGTTVNTLPNGDFAGTTVVRNRDGEVTGAVRVQFSSNRIGNHFDVYRTEYLIGVVALLVALVLGSWFLSRRLARPIGLMVRAARTVEMGRQPEPAVAASLRNTSLTRDEYGELAGVFLDMAREVGAREIQLNALVEARTEELSVKNRELEEAQREIRNDLEMAHSVQAALVPSELPDDPRAGIAAYMTPALDVGGDFYDAFITDDGRLAFSIADVSGKGVASALMMAVGRAVLRSAANQHPDPSEAIASTNDQLCSMNPKELFITAFFGVIDLQLGTLTYVNAGHDPPYIMSSGGAPEMIPHTGGIALGVLPGLSYAETTLPLDPDVTLFLYTDGITEAENATGQQFGRERLEEKLTSLSSETPGALMDDILHDLAEFQGDAKQFDDITCMAVQFNGGEASLDSYIPGQGDARLASGWRRMVVQPSLDTSLPRVAAFIERFAESEGFDATEVFRLNLALDELLTNTLEHGFPDETGDAEITVALRSEGDMVVARYEDNGPEFNPLEAAEQDTELELDERPIGGLGLQLIAASFDAVNYERVNDRNVTTLRQRRASASDDSE
ncbi:MAG: SpoIIE family protein phosphatase [Chloroflexi bacterium]|nr:SpoIIE family protein phosphatase [Chloroflexota bacterium]MCY3697379.1 SpoIIE family protein phosphatase [Chloroflexota bacterium]